MSGPSLGCALVASRSSETPLALPGMCHLRGQPLISHGLLWVFVQRPLCSWTRLFVKRRSSLSVTEQGYLQHETCHPANPCTPAAPVHTPAASVLLGNAFEVAGAVYISPVPTGHQELSQSTWMAALRLRGGLAGPGVSNA